MNQELRIMNHGILNPKFQILNKH